MRKFSELPGLGDAMRWTVTVAACLASSALAAGEAPLASWRANCRSPHDAFDVSISSASGDAYEDDMAIVLSVSSKGSLRIPLSPAMYQPRSSLQNVENLCDNIAAVDVGTDRALIFLSRSNRPDVDRLDVVLVDIRRLLILDTKPDVASIKTNDPVFVLRRIATESFDVRLIKELIAGSGCDCEAQEIEDWMRISVRGDKIQTRWMSR
jgi:hypothetical protein